MSIKEQYWKYSLIVIILFMGIIIFRQITPFLGGLLGALTIYILVRTQMTHLTEKWKLKRSVAALLITAETVMVFLVPLGLTIWLLVNQLQDINLDPHSLPRCSRWQSLSKKKRVMMCWEKIPCHSLSPSSPASDK